jgi:hypothetical protein
MIDDAATDGDVADDAVDPLRHIVPTDTIDIDSQDEDDERPLRSTRQSAARERMLDRMADAENDFGDELDAPPRDFDRLGGI